MQWHGIFQTPGKVRRKGRDGSKPRDVNSTEANANLNPPTPSSNSTSISPIRTGTQDIISPSHSIITKKGRNAEPLDAPINVFLAVNRHSTSIFSKLIGHKLVPGEGADVYARKMMKFVRNFVIGKSPNFMDLGLSPAIITDKINSVFASTTRV